MKVTVTLGQIFDSRKWKKYCKKYNITPYVLSMSERNNLTQIKYKHALKWGIIKGIEFP